MSHVRKSNRGKRRFTDTNSTSKHCIFERTDPAPINLFAEDINKCLTKTRPNQGSNIEILWIVDKLGNTRRLLFEPGMLKEPFGLSRNLLRIVSHQSSPDDLSAVA